MKMVYMGTPEFAVAPLVSLVEAGYQIAAVVTQPDKAKDRGKKMQFSPVKEKALSYGIEVLQPEKVKGNDDFFQRLKEINPSCIIVAAYGKILPKEILELPRFGCINIHGSLLPKLRGAAPIQWAIVNGEEKTGITLMKMDVGLDTGDMLALDEVEIGNKNAAMLYDELSLLGAKLLIEKLPEILQGELKAIKQEEDKATYAPMLTKQTGNIDFQDAALSIERMIRGLDPWPCAYSTYQGIPVKIKQAQVLTEQSSQKPGTILAVSSQGLKVATGQGILLITKIQFPNKKAMNVGDYIKGNTIQEGTVLGK